MGCDRTFTATIQPVPTRITVPSGLYMDSMAEATSRLGKIRISQGELMSLFKQLELAIAQATCIIKSFSNF